MTRNGASASVFLFWGAVSGSGVGVADAIMGLVKSGAAFPAKSIALLFVVAAGALIPVGAMAGLCCFAFARLVLEHISLRHLTRTLVRPKPLMGIIALFVLLTAGVIAVGYHRGIEVDAIDFRPLVYGIFVLGGTVLGTRFLRPGPNLSRLMASFFIAFGVGGAISAIPNIGHAAGLLELIDNGTAAVRPLLDVAKRGFDRDGDGFPSRICEQGCDCDDKDPHRNPGALDIPDNGIDEDCSGADLTMASRPSKPAEPPTPAEDRTRFTPPYNIILVTIDTVRADRVHSYGYTRETTPNLDRFAASSVRFQQVRSQGPSTRHVFPPFLTGRYFTSLDLRKGEKWFDLLGSNDTFAELLKKKGYRTLAFLPYFRFKFHSGFQQGFDVWEPTLGSDRNPTFDPTGDLMTDKGISQLQDLQAHKGPWLLWLHYFDPHGHYVKHEGQKPDFGRTRADRYDGEILYADNQVNRFFDAVKERGMWEDTAIIVASDHGEGIGLDTDHGFNYHGFSLFDSETRVPLMIKVPKAAPAVVKECVALIDVMPTILELGGMTPPADLHGVSLIPYVLGGHPDRGPFLTQLADGRKAEAVVDWPYKLIHEIGPNKYSLYQLEEDPNEQKDLVNALPEQTARLKELLQILRFEAARTK